ncbi:MAG: HepT-like ribonuclease domain-containing protein, partial [Bacteroidota bacterium]
RIAHDYTGIDRFITYEIIKEDLPRLEIDLQKIITEQIGSSNFDMNELLAAKGNQYYAHVDFDELPE